MSSLLFAPPPQPSDNPLYISKIVIVGDTGVGKTALIRRFVHREPTSTHYMTIGVDFTIKEFDIDTQNISVLLKPTTRMRFHLWDTAGQERFRTVTTMYYKEATSFILTFALDDPDSFTHITEYWYPEIVRMGHPRSHIVLVGNKKDRYIHRNSLLDKVVKRWTEKNKINYYETDTNDMLSIHTLFNDIGTQIMKNAITFYGDLPGFKDSQETFRRIQLRYSDDDGTTTAKKNKKWYDVCDCCVPKESKDDKGGRGRNKSI